MILLICTPCLYPKKAGCLRKRYKIQCVPATWTNGLKTYLDWIKWNHLYLMLKPDASSFLWTHFIVRVIIQLPSQNQFEQIYSLKIFHILDYGEFGKNRPCSPGFWIRQGNEKNERNMKKLNPSVPTHACMAMLKIMGNFQSYITSQWATQSKSCSNEDYIFDNWTNFVS